LASPFQGGNFRTEQKEEEEEKKEEKHKSKMEDQVMVSTMADQIMT
jgi:hypothetical protein